MNRNRKLSGFSPGFTIIELMITLVIGAILLVVGVPSYQSLIRNNRLTTQNNLFVGSLQLARSEAVKRSTTVSLVANVGGGAGNEWGVGWQIVVDTNGNGAVDGGELVLKNQAAFDGDNELDSAAGVTAITYQRTGFATAAAAFPLVFDLCHDAGLAGRQISLNITGRVSTDSDYTCP